MITLPTNSFDTLERAASHYLKSTSQAIPTAVCIAVAGPVVNGNATLTNNTWQINQDALRQTFATNLAFVLNDFEAIAHALPEIGASESCTLGGPGVNSSAPRRCLGVIGPGTGLGAAGVIIERQHVTAIVSEAGHVGFAPESDVQRHILTRLASRYGRVSDERVVSGQGISNIYWALSDSDHDLEDAATIFERFETGTDDIAQQAVEEFFRCLGQVSGNFALALGAYDGIFIAGGIAQRHAHVLKKSAFRSGFEAKGRHSELMASIPTRLIEHPYPGLLGAKMFAAAYAC